MTDNVKPNGAGDEKARLKRRQSLEASVTVGLGYGKKKKQNIEAFYSAVWPVLEGVGWTLVSEPCRRDFVRCFNLCIAGYHYG